MRKSPDETVGQSDPKADAITYVANKMTEQLRIRVGVSHAPVLLPAKQPPCPARNNSNCGGVQGRILILRQLARRVGRTTRYNFNSRVVPKS